MDVLPANRYSLFYLFIYLNFPKEISERRKKHAQWPRLKKAREAGKTAFFSKPEPINCLSMDDLFPYRQI